VAPQALFLMNDDFVVRAGRGLAERVRKELSGDVRGQVRRAWALTQGRAPSAAEESRFLELLAEQTESLREYDRKHPPAKGAVAEDPTLQALGSLCQALLASNHLLHLE
jgi:hypothetical protein